MTSLRDLPLLLLVGLVAVSCGDDDDDEDDDTSDASGAGECGDVDGSGGDTGDVPNILGSWTATFGQHTYDGGLCTVDGLEEEDFYWLNGAMEIDGRPDTLYIDFDEDRFWGSVTDTGGVIFSGSRVVGGHTLYISFGGLLYRQPQTDRDELRGFGYVGVDIDSDDSAIDCWLQGDFRMTKSGF